MLDRVSEVATGALLDLSLFKKVDVWEGQLEDLMNHPKQLPAAYIALSAGLFLNIKTFPPTSARLRMAWDVLVFYSALSPARISPPSIFGLIESVVAPASAGGLTGLKVDDHGILWPEDLELISTKNGSGVYRIGFYIESECTGT